MFQRKSIGFLVIGGPSPVLTSISIKGVFPISLESLEKMSLYSLHSSLKAFWCSFVTSASCKSTFLCMSISAGEVLTSFHYIQMQFLSFVL